MIGLEIERLPAIAGSFFARGLLIAALYGLLLACSTKPPKDIRPLMSGGGAHSVHANSVLGIRYLARSSYLPGEKASDAIRPFTITARHECVNKRGGVFFLRPRHARPHSGASDRDLAEELCKMLGSLSEFTDSATTIFRIYARLVPEGIEHAWSGISFGGRTLSYKIALREYSGESDIGIPFNRYAVRTIAHELFHVTMSLSSAVDRDPESEEVAAHLLEPCVELSVFGSANAIATGDEMNFSASSSSPEKTSVTARWQAVSILKGLSLPWPLERIKNPTEAGVLIAECKGRVRMLKRR